MLTYSETKDGTVGTVTIDGSTLFLDGSTYSPDVPVVVKYYALLEETEPDTSEEETPQAAETESEPIYTADASSIKQLAEDKFSFDYADLTVEWDDTDEAFVVSFYPTATPLDESTWVYQSINRYIKFCQFAYNIDGLERIRFDISASGTDQRGNEVTFLGLSVLMSRENFALYDWDNLSYMGIWDSFVDDCYVFSLAQAFSSQLDTSKIFYDPLLRNGQIA
jgi:hypothetical protein